MGLIQAVQNRKKYGCYKVTLLMTDVKSPDTPVGTAMGTNKP